MNTNYNGVEFDFSKYGEVDLDVINYNGVEVWTGARSVTYIANGSSHVEKVNRGASALTPGVTPEKDGAIFLGWTLSTEDPTPLDNLVVDRADITLYAIFRYNDSTTPRSASASTDNGGYREQNTIKNLFEIDGTKYASITVKCTQADINAGRWATATTSTLYGGTTDQEADRSIFTKSYHNFNDEAYEFISLNNVGEEYEYTLSNDANAKFYARFKGSMYNGSASFTLTRAIGRTIVG